VVSDHRIFFLINGGTGLLRFVIWVFCIVFPPV
jgi:hypothetical protein